MYDPHREFCRRQHRLLGHYLALEAWLRKTDGLAIDRDALERMLGLARFKATRVEWLLSDIEPWFPYNEQFSYSNTKLAGIWVSRVPLDSIPTGRMSDEARISRIPSKGPRIAAFSAKADVIPMHEELVSYLALLADGLASPSERFTLKPVRSKRIRKTVT